MRPRALAETKSLNVEREQPAVLAERKNVKIAALCAVIVLSSGCAGTVTGLYPPGEGESVKSIYVVSHGWHTGVVVRRQDIPDGVWPEHHDFADSKYVEIGWGDRDYYRAPEATSGLALKAVFWPTSSILHIVGFDDPLERVSPGSDIVKIDLSDHGHKALSTFIQEAYARDKGDRAIALGPGQGTNSRFYLASEKYYLLKTCNNWTARALRSAGLPITPLYAVTARNVMYQVRKFATTISSK